MFIPHWLLYASFSKTGICIGLLRMRRSRFAIQIFSFTLVSLSSAITFFFPLLLLLFQ